MRKPRYSILWIFLFLALPYFLFSSAYNDFERFPLPKDQLERIAPYLLPEDHPVKKTLDSIFLSSRPTLNLDQLIKAGFRPSLVQPRSFVIVASHPLLPGYLVKLQLDTELRLKQEKPYWEWMVRRLEAAKRIEELIEKNNLQHFVVAKKWLYPLPLNPPVPNSPIYEQKLLLVLVTDMQLVPMKENFLAWNTKITKKHLDELYLLLSQGYISSFRPDNICYTKAGKFAFIDTEHHSSTKPPAYRCRLMRKRLNPEMQAYWDSLLLQHTSL